MSDAQFIPALVEIASNDSLLLSCQRAAARAILTKYRLVYPKDSCAITQSKLFEAAGLEIDDTYLALGFDNMLKKRDWLVIPASDVLSGKTVLMAGDIGTTCFANPDPGVDHVYLVVDPINKAENLVADNQAPGECHIRFTAGSAPHSQSPTTYFLRAPA